MISYIKMLWCELFHPIGIRESEVDHELGLYCRRCRRWL